MTPGPTQIRENVLSARALPATNPDLDYEFFDFYKATCERIGKLINAKHPFYILSGEGILGLEAACASLTEYGDRVLVLDNGEYGGGFADFVKMYGGEAVVLKFDPTKEIDCDELSTFLERDNTFKYATLVHCDTPSGVLNDAERICSILKKHQILTVVDAVSSMFGTEVAGDTSDIDILCGASQKALSTPPGLTLVSVSTDAYAAMDARKTPISSYYCNLLTFRDYYEKKLFPYTMPIHDIQGLSAAITNLEDKRGDGDIYTQHELIAEGVRKALVAGNLSLFLESGFSPTVTVCKIPQGLTCEDILRRMNDTHKIMIAGSFGFLEGKVFRIGHMGENASIVNVRATLLALEETLTTLGFACGDMVSVFDDFVH